MDENIKKQVTETTDKRFSLRELINIVSLFGFFYGELDERLDLKDAIREQLSKPVPKHVNLPFCFGGITFLLIVVNIITGVFLMMYYRPTTSEAYSSVLMITNEVEFGWLMRGIHHWSASIMVVSIILHMLRVFVYGAYKHPREFNWVVGVILFMVVLGFGFTGYLLPWNQISYWATTVGTEIPGAIPVIGPAMVGFLRGGNEVSAVTLTRFYAIHVAVLPVMILFLLMMHFLMIRRQGIVGPL